MKTEQKAKLEMKKGGRKMKMGGNCVGEKEEVSGKMRLSSERG